MQKISKKLVIIFLTLVVSTLNLSAIAEAEFDNSLPIGKTYISEPEGQSVGTVYFFPQYHKAPGTNYQDKVNDKSLQSQKETYQIMKSLLNEKSINLLMVEGELYGELSKEKKDYLKEEIKANNQLKSEYEKLKLILSKNPVNPNQEIVLAKIENSINSFERKLLLQGAPIKLWSEMENLEIWGAENENTIKASGDIVRESYYLKDAMNKKGPVSKKSMDKEEMLKKIAQGDQKKLIMLMALMNKDKAPKVDNLDELQNEAKEESNDEAYEAISTFKAKASALKEDLKEKKPVEIKEKLPTRADNPFLNKNKEELEKLAKENQKKMKDVIVNQRNKETAENFVRALRESGEDVGILQYGAGHESGLVKELNKLGLKVIVITPDTVANSR